MILSIGTPRLRWAVTARRGAPRTARMAELPSVRLLDIVALETV
jgi:hypothetical protein